MIPAISYDGNRWGRGHEPKGFSHEGAWWSFAWHRSSVPASTYAEYPAWTVAFWSPAVDSMGLACSLMPEENHTTHRIIYPEEELPLRYSARDTYAPGYRRQLSLGNGEKFRIEARLLITPIEPQHRAISHFLGKAWEAAVPDPLPSCDPGELWNLSRRFLTEQLWAEEGDFRGFSIGLLRRDQQWVQRWGWKYEIGWAGQNASMSVSLLHDFLRHGNVESREKALACLDSWAGACPLPNGLFRIMYDYVLGLEKGEEVLDACNLGDAAFHFLEAWELSDSCGFTRDNYRDLALSICDFMLNDQQSSGQFGKGWNLEGECLYRDGTIGAFIVPAMIKAWQVTGDERYLSSAIRGYDFYFNDFAETGYTSAGALDTWCIDKESSVPMLQAALMLYYATGDRIYLDRGEMTAWYISSWVWHHSARYPPESDFSSHGFNTFGMTSVSTQHHHLDPFGVFILPELLELSKLTGNDHWRQKAYAMWDAGNQMISDGTLEVHGITRPAGSQTEAYFQTGWIGEPGSVNDWLVCWMGAFRMESLRRLGDEEGERLTARSME